MTFFDLLSLFLHLLLVLSQLFQCLLSSFLVGYKFFLIFVNFAFQKFNFIFVTELRLSQFLPKANVDIFFAIIHHDCAIRTPFHYHTLLYPSTLFRWLLIHKSPSFLIQKHATLDGASRRARRTLTGSCFQSSLMILFHFCNICIFVFCYFLLFREKDF